MSSLVQYMQRRSHTTPRNTHTKLPFTKISAAERPRASPLSGFISLKAMPLQRLASVKGNTLSAETATHLY